MSDEKTFTPGNEMTSEKSKKVNTLIRAECCNYDNGNCSLLDNGEYHKCPQVSIRELSCSWFIEAVLPLNSVLEGEVLNTSQGTTKKKCVVCGKTITATSNRVKYCQKCLIKVRKAQNTARKQKQRQNLRIY